MVNTKVDRAFYTCDGRNLVIDPVYFELLPVGTYTFKAVGGSSAYEFTVRVTAVSETVLKDITVQQGCNAVIYLGNVKVNTVSVNGRQLSIQEYEVENLMLTIGADLLSEGVNTIVINGNKTLTVTLD